MWPFVAFHSFVKVCRMKGPVFGRVLVLPGIRGSSRSNNQTFKCWRNLPSGPRPTPSFVVDAAITQQDRRVSLRANATPVRASQLPCHSVYFCFCFSSLLFSLQTINQTTSLHRSFPPLLNEILKSAESGVWGGAPVQKTVGPITQ
jgi:hypothetical protein